MDPLLQELLVVVGLLIGSLLAILAEIFIISFGLLTALAVVLASWGLYDAFAISTAAGVVASLGFAAGVVLILTVGLKGLRRSSLVPQAEITGDAGYHHHAAGLALGASGILVTSARPTGRARFILANGPIELDVSLDGSAETGDAVVVTRIEGPAIHARRVAHPAT